MARIRPTKDGENWGDRTVKKVSPRTLSVGDRTFSFDSVFDSKSGQVWFSIILQLYVLTPESKILVQTV